MIDEKKLVKEICNTACIVPEFETDELLNAFLLGLNTKQICVMDLIANQPKIGEWIPFKLDEDGILESPLPEEDQEILISDGDFVWTDTFLKDGEDCYLDSNIDLIGLYWMPLPKPHKKEAEE